jgi:hypothetical protein
VEKRAFVVAETLYEEERVVAFWGAVNGGHLNIRSEEKELGGAKPPPPNPPA